jgi:uncharacterized membrane protein
MAKKQAPKAMRQYVIMGILVAIFFLVAAYYYPVFPEKVASHWNAQGEVDGYMSKFWGIFLMPLVAVFITLLSLVLPKIDPLKKEFEKFKSSFYVFIDVLLLFFLYIYILTILWNTGTQFNMTRAITPAIGVLFIVVGWLLKNARQNWFVGIRTPWTLSYKRVWEKTHQLASKLFMVSGVLALLGFFFPDLAIWLLLAPVLATVVISVFYSYWLSRKE